MPETKASIAFRPTHRDDRETPLLLAGMAELIILIYRIVKRNIFDFGAYMFLKIRSGLPRLRQGSAGRGRRVKFVTTRSVIPGYPPP